VTSIRLVCVGGSDAGIAAALRARELDPEVDVTVLLADAYPNFSICGLPYAISGEVARWQELAHRTTADLEATGMRLRTNTTARSVDVDRHRLLVTTPEGRDEWLGYERLVIGTGAVPVVPPVDGLRDTAAGPGLGPADGVHVLHTMDDMFDVLDSIQTRDVETALVVGAGYIGLEMADALTVRGIRVTQVEALPQVLPTVDPELAAVIETELTRHGVDVLTGTTVNRIARDDHRLTVTGDPGLDRAVDLVLVVVGVQPDTTLAVTAGVTLGTAAVKGAIVVDERMRTGVPDVFAAGDCVHTHHRLLPEPTYIPLGTTAHKQGRVAGENAVGGDRAFSGSLGTQVVKVFDLAVARTGLRDHEAAAAGFAPVTVGSTADDHKRYYPGAHELTVRVTGDARTGRLLGMQLVGHMEGAVAKRVDIAAAALFAGLAVDQVSDLDLAYTPPLGSPWDAVQAAAQAWSRALR
jgi:NADPH-dependent 2,4-dienoyl-CoA reductase/sulfur reductase-like enzyme